jgi:hypothetical protein
MSDTTSAVSLSRPMKEDAGRGRLVLEMVLSGGKRSEPSWKRGDWLCDVLQPVLTQLGQHQTL